MNFVAIDFETANSNRSSICALGVAMVHNGELLDTAHFLIKPVPNYYDSFNSQLHGIRDKHTRDLPTLKEQWADLREFFEGLIVAPCGQHWTSTILSTPMSITTALFS